MIDQLLDKLQGWADAFVLHLPNLGAALLVLVAAWIVANLTGRTVDPLMSRISDHRSLNLLVRKLARFTVFAAGFLIALHILELDDAAMTLLAGAGIIGLALGFAFQDLSANFISGVAMAVRRPMQVGDLIETNDHFGIVERIDLRSSWLRTLDGKLVMIPNRKIYENAMVNHSRLGHRRVDLEVGVSYGDDLAEAMRLTVAAVESIQPRLDRAVELFYREFGSSSINFEVRFWIPFARQTDYLEARHQAVMAIKRTFDEHDITIPFPIRTLDFGIVGGERLRDQLIGWSEGAPERRDATGGERGRAAAS